MENNSFFFITYKVITIIIAIFTLIYAIRKMVEINTNYKYRFGLGISLLVLLILSFFYEQWWINNLITILICLCIYFFITILIKSENEINKP